MQRKLVNKKACKSGKSIFSFLALSVLLSVVSCGKNQQAPVTEMELPVSKVQIGNGLIEQEYPATIEGITDVEVRPQISGYISRILADEGDYVHAGQALFVIDSRIYQEQYKNAKAAVQVAQANLTSAKIELNRKKELVKDKIVSDLQLQQARASYDAAVAGLAQAQAAAGSAKINYEFCTVKAPVSGYLGKFPYRLGSLVSPSGVEPLTVLSDVRKVNVYFSMSEVDFLNFQRKHVGNTMQEKIANAEPVGLKFADGELYPEKGNIDAVEGNFSNNTGSIMFRAKFDNSKGLLRAGNTGKVIIEQQYDNVILLPVASTYSVQDKVYVYTLGPDGKAVQNPLEVFGKTGNNYMVSSGIKAGDTYVVSGFERLQPGMKVKPLKSAVAKN